MARGLLARSAVYEGTSPQGAEGLRGRRNRVPSEGFRGAGEGRSTQQGAREKGTSQPQGWDEKEKR